MPLLFAILIWSAGAALGVTETPAHDGITYRQPSGFRGLLQSGLFDLGIAILITVFVGEGLQRTQERRLDEIRDAESSRSKRDLFRQFFGSFFDDRAIQEATDAIFSKRLFRNRFYVEYTFSRHPILAEIIYLDSLVDYELTNPSDVTESFSPTWLMPVIAAHYPGVVELEAPSVSLVRLTFGDKVIDFDAADLSRINSAIDRTEPQATLGLGEYELGGGQSVRVETHYRVPKFSGDAETMRMFYSTGNVVIEVNNTAGPELSVDLSPIHNRSFPKRAPLDGSGKRFSWDIRRIFLPSNGWVLFWNDSMRDIRRNPTSPGITSA